MRKTPIMTAIFLALTVALGAAAAFAQSAKTSLEGEQAAAFNRVSDRLVCQCGCQMILRVCNHFECPSAVPMRAKIEAEILAGTSEDAIVEGFAEEYGMIVLSSPPARGVNLAAWVMPGFAVLIGAFLVFYIAADWVAKRKVKPVDAEAAAELDTELASRIEAELEESR